jgi:diguanylate cyclase (GGDEF)-like protein/PAS domain S-box-containing protein
MEIVSDERSEHCECSDTASGNGPSSRVSVLGGKPAGAIDLDQQALEDRFVAFMDPDGVVVSSTPFLQDLLGSPESPLKGRKITDVLPPNGAGAVLGDALRHVALHREKAQGTISLKPATGMRFEFSVSPFRHTDGRTFSVLTVVPAAACAQDSPRTLQSLALLPDEDPNPILRVSPQGTLLYANTASWFLLVHWKTQVGCDVPPEWLKEIRRAVEIRDIVEQEVRIGYKTILLVIVPMAEKGYINLYGLDVTRRRRVEDKLRLSAQVFENISEGIMIMDGDRRILDVNRAFTAITGYPREDVLGESAESLSMDGMQRPTAAEIWAAAREQGSWQGEIWDRRKDGEAYPQWLSLSVIADPSGEITGYIGLFSDITAKKDAEQRLYQMAHFDNLTGLGNRHHFQDVLERTLRNARRTGEVVALMFVDLDEFKTINDNLGHGAGDTLLRTVATRLQNSVRESDIATRMGGDEFTVILPNLQAPENAGLIGRKILGNVTEPMDLKGREIFITASIGIAVFPQDAQDAAGLLQCADAAMYHAKESGKNGCHFFAREMDQRAEERLVLQTKIRHALMAKEFIVHYQPQVDMISGRVIGMEALVRWERPGQGLLYPDSFVPLAEQSGQISEIGAHVLREVCLQGARWRARGLPNVRLGVNVSSRQLRRTDFISLIEAVLDESQLPASSLEVELTESMLIVDDRNTLNKMERLRGIGVSLAIDDFGTKYSSFGYLKRMPIGRLKIDRLFVQGLAEEKSSRNIIAAIIAMGRTMNLDVVAEGVETEAQISLLLQMGCAVGQGFYFGKAVPAAEAEALLGKGLHPTWLRGRGEEFDI